MLWGNTLREHAPASRVAKGWWHCGGTRTDPHPPWQAREGVACGVCGFPYTTRPPERSLTDNEWMVRLGECYGSLCAAYQRGAGAELDRALDAYIRALNQWRRERES